jgi:hypothetical protein
VNARRRRPASTALDLEVDLNSEDDSGLPRGLLDEAKDPASIKEGGWMVVGTAAGYAQTMTLHLIRGTGAATITIDVTGYAPVNAGGCTCATEVTTYTG